MLLVNRNGVFFVESEVFLEHVVTEPVGGKSVKQAFVVVVSYSASILYFAYMMS